MLKKKNFLITLSFLGKAEIALALILMLVGATWTFNSISDTKDSAAQEKIYHAMFVESSNIVSLRLDLLNYARTFFAWQAGFTARIEVQEARDVLYKNTISFPVGSSIVYKKISTSIIRTISISDAILARSQPGFVTKLAIATENEPSLLLLHGINSTVHSLTIANLSVLDKIQVWHSLRNGFFRLQQQIFPSLFIAILFAFILTSGKNSNRKKSNSRVELDAQFALLEGANRKLHLSQDLVGKLRLLDKRKDSFITTINHEIRTPLTAIIGFTEILKSRQDLELNTSAHEYIDIIHRNSIVLTGLVENILQLSMLDDENIEIVKSRFDLIDTLKDNILALLPQSSSVNITIILKNKTFSELSLFANREQISQAFANILSNAVKYSNENSKIEIVLTKIKIAKEFQKVRVSFVDQGRGIPTSDQDSIFSSFFRASNVVESTLPGSGLGLTITRKIIESHGGTITMKSKEGIGSTFDIELPLAPMSVNSFITQRQNSVLQRAITALESSDIDQMEAVSHEMSGALGFYELYEESRAIVNFYEWPKENEPLEDGTFTIKKDELLAKLRVKLAALDKGAGE